MGIRNSWFDTEIGILDMAFEKLDEKKIQKKFPMFNSRFVAVVAFEVQLLVV